MIDDIKKLKFTKLKRKSNNMGISEMIKSSKKDRRRRVTYIDAIIKRFEFLRDLREGKIIGNNKLKIEAYTLGFDPDVHGRGRDLRFNSVYIEFLENVRDIEKKVIEKKLKKEGLNDLSFDRFVDVNINYLVYNVYGKPVEYRYNFVDSIRVKQGEDFKDRVFEEFNKHIENQFQVDMLYEIETSNIEIDFAVNKEQREEIKKLDLKRRKMRESRYYSSLTRFRDSGIGMCAVEYIINKYKKYIPTLTIKKLLEIMNCDKDNVTTLSVERFCKKYRIPMYSFDFIMYRFYNYYPEKPSHNYPSLAYQIIGNHFNGIDIKKRSIFANNGFNYSYDNKEKIVESTFGAVLFNSIDDIIKKINDEVFMKSNKLHICILNKSDLNDEFVTLVYKYNIIPSKFDIKMSGSNITRIMIIINDRRSILIYSIKNYKELSEDMESLMMIDNDGIKYDIRNKKMNIIGGINQLVESDMRIGIDYFNIKDIEILDKSRSKLNEETMKLFLDKTQTVSPLIYNKFSLWGYDDLCNIDIKKCYKTCITSDEYKDPKEGFMGHNKSDFLVIDSACIPEKININKNKISEYLKKNNYLYYIESDDYYLLDGCGLRTRDILLCAVYFNIKFKVTAIIKPYKYLPKTLFDKWAGDITKSCKKHKSIINKCLGYLGGKQSNKYIYLGCTDDKNELLNKYYDDEANYKIRNIKGTKHYAFFIRKIVKHVDNYLPIHIQKLCNSRIMMFKLKKLLEYYKINIAGANTDCYYIEKRDVVKLRKLFKSKFGINYKIEENKNGSFDKYYKGLENPFILNKIIKDFKNKKGIKSDKKIKNFIDFDKINKKFTNYRFEEKDKDLYMNTVKKILDLDDSINITGMAGSGKTFLAKKLCKELKSKGIMEVRLAPTNRASLLLKGKTLHKFLQINEKGWCHLPKNINDIKYIIIDEISLISGLYSYLYKLKLSYPNLKFIMIGDFLQCRPVEDKINGIKRDYKNSYILKYFSNYNRLDLKENRRSDSTAEQMRELLIAIEEEDCVIWNKFSSSRIKKDFGYTNLCYFNKTRRKVNNILMNRYIREHKSKKTFKYKKVTYTKKQLESCIYYNEFYLYKNLPVMSIKNFGCKKKENNREKSLYIFNNELFDVIKVLKSKVYLKSRDRKKETIIKLDYCSFKLKFVPSYCITVYKYQGMTIDKEYYIHDIVKMNKEEIYTAVTRCTNINYINIVNDVSIG